MSGSNLQNQIGIYGTQGIPSSLNIPGARYGASNWIDSNDNFWLFGGFGYDSIGSNSIGLNNYLNDLWKFDGYNWTWVSGIDLIDSISYNGDIISSLNTPPARAFAMNWIANNTIFIFGGLAKNFATFANDFWKLNLCSTGNFSPFIDCKSTQSSTHPSTHPSTHNSSTNLTPSYLFLLFTVILLVL